MTTPTRADLDEAKHAAQEAERDARVAERDARAARRRADARQKHYEDLVLIAQGQQTLPFD